MELALKFGSIGYNSQNYDSCGSSLQAGGHESPVYQSTTHRGPKARKGTSLLLASAPARRLQGLGGLAPGGRALRFLETEKGE